MCLQISGLVEFLSDLSAAITMRAELLAAFSMMGMALSGPARRDCGQGKCYDAVNSCGMKYGGQVFISSNHFSWRPFSDSLQLLDRMCRWRHEYANVHSTTLRFQCGARFQLRCQLSYADFRCFTNLSIIYRQWYSRIFDYDPTICGIDCCSLSRYRLIQQLLAAMALH